MKKNLLILKQKRDYDNALLEDYFLINQNDAVSNEESEKTLRFVVSEFLKTEEGIRSIKNSLEIFDWGCVLSHIPNSFWSQYGIRLLRHGEDFTASAIREVSVIQEEVLC